VSDTSMAGTVSVRWHSNEYDAAAVVRAELSARYGVRDVSVGRLCGRCGSSGHGRPWARVGGRHRVAVSWSRAEGHLVTAISPTRPVGVDVEAVRQVSALWPLAEALGPGEHAGDVEELTWLWVAKEAILKAKGVGLSEPMDQFCVRDYAGDLLRLDAPPGLVAAVALHPLRSRASGARPGPATPGRAGQAPCR